MLVHRQVLSVYGTYMKLFVAGVRYINIISAVTILYLHCVSVFFE